MGKILESRGIGKQPQLRTTNCHLLSQNLECLQSFVGEEPGLVITLGKPGRA